MFVTQLQDWLPDTAHVLRLHFIFGLAIKCPCEFWEILQNSRHPYLSGGMRILSDLVFAFVCEGLTPHLELKSSSPLLIEMNKSPTYISIGQEEKLFRSVFRESWK